jgi:hypothetical protein
MLRNTRFLSSISQAELFIRNNQFAELSKFLSTVRKRDPPVTEEDWHRIVDRVIKDDSALTVAGPSLLISTSSMNFSLTFEQKSALSLSLSKSFSHMSQFDKIVTLIGVSQLGIRTPEIISLISEFISEEVEVLPENFLPSILLAVANLAINNQRAWGTLIARVSVETLNSHELANMSLAIATSRSFPISLIERIVNTAVSTPTSSVQDALALCHSLTCLEVYQTDLFRSLLDKLSREQKFDPDSIKLMKQIILAVFIDVKAKSIIDSIAPTVWHRFDKLIDWTIPEPRRIHGTVGEEIQAMISEESESTVSSVTIPSSIADWTREVAKTVAMDRFYISDVSGCPERMFIHIDDETFPDCTDGPIDPYLQIKHSQIGQCGFRLVWIREHEWDDKERERVRDLLK